MGKEELNGNVFPFNTQEQDSKMTSALKEKMGEVGRIFKQEFERPANHNGSYEKVCQISGEMENTKKEMHRKQTFLGEDLIETEILFMGSYKDKPELPKYATCTFAPEGKCLETDNFQKLNEIFEKYEDIAYDRDKEAWYGKMNKLYPRTEDLEEHMSSKQKEASENRFERLTRMREGLLEIRGITEPSDYVFKRMELDDDERKENLEISINGNHVKVCQRFNFCFDEDLIEAKLFYNGKEVCEPTDAVEAMAENLFEKYGDFAYDLAEEESDLIGEIRAEQERKLWEIQNEKEKMEGKKALEEIDRIF